MVQNSNALPLNICLNFHSNPWRSLATNSCVGVAWVISYQNINSKQHMCKAFNQPLELQYEPSKHKIRVITNWGRHSVACFRRTENPPWVLVSEAVKILQNECTVCLGGSGGHISGLLGSLCCNITITTNKFFLFEYLIHKVGHFC